jgi:ketosteroid isomerase-like protein
MRALPGGRGGKSREAAAAEPVRFKQSKGIEAYRKTWDLFFSWSLDPMVFDVGEMNITAGNDVAFVTALMRCAGTESSGERIRLEFRLTIGLRKIGGQWTVIHEHHSIPAS